MFKKNGVEKDIANTLNIARRRREAIEATPATPLPKTNKVNELSANLHPGIIKAEIVKIEPLTSLAKRITFRSMAPNKRFPFFKAGQYITVSARVGKHLVTRPYSIYSSPNQALDGIIENGVLQAGYFSNNLCLEARVGDVVLSGEPSGEFYYDNLRDSSHIVAVAGGSGITPFVSMIKALLEKSDNFNLTLIYGVKTLNDLMYDACNIHDPRIKQVVVLSNEQREGYEHGFITRDILAKYVTSETSVFMCGPNPMYAFVLGELNKLGYDEHRVRMEHNCIGDLNEDSDIEYTLTVHMRDETFTIPARKNETLLVAMEKAGLAAPSRCRSGYCGFCHSRLIKGNIYTPEEHDHRRAADRKFGYVHPCATYPHSHVEIDVPVLDALKET